MLFRLDILDYAVVLNIPCHNYTTNPPQISNIHKF